MTRKLIKLLNQAITVFGAALGFGVLLFTLSFSAVMMFWCFRLGWRCAKTLFGI